MNPLIRSFIDTCVLMLMIFGYIHLTNNKPLHNGNELSNNFINMAFAHAILTGIIISSNMFLYQYDSLHKLSHQFKRQYLIIEFILLISHLCLTIALIGVGIKIYTDTDENTLESDTIRTGFILTYCGLGLALFIDILNLFM